MQETKPPRILRDSFSPGLMVMKTRLRVAGIERESIVDGPGVRLTIFTQGCHHNCKGCHNPKTHDPEGGAWMPLWSIVDIYKENPLYQGITLSGGEPFLQAYALYYLSKYFKEKKLGDVVTYTGYVIQDLITKQIGSRMNSLYVVPLLRMTDMLIDGPFIEEQRNLELKYKGSENQVIYTKDEIAQILRDNNINQL